MGIKHKLIRGFTIIELLIVIAVIGILAGITAVIYNGVQANAHDTSVLSDLDTMDGLQTNYSLKNNGNAKPYYSVDDGPDSELDFAPSGENVIDVVTDGEDYCIRGYNPKGTKNSIFNAYSKGSSQEACTILPASSAASGLSSQWGLNGDTGDGGEAGNMGTIYGGTSVADLNGQPGRAYNFNGTSDYIDFGTDADYDYSEFTVSIWAKADSSTQTHVKNLIGKGSWNSTNNWFIGFRDATFLTFVYGLSWSQGPVYNLNQFDVTQWHHYVGVATETLQQIYLDGNLVASKAGTHTTVTNTYPMQIARSSYYANFFDGTIDDARIYAHALSGDDIKSIYNEGPQ